MGLYYYNARWYDPNLGRFITEDPIKDSTNYHIYCNNNPINYIDPTGLADEDISSQLAEINSGFEFDLDFGSGLSDIEEVASDITLGKEIGKSGETSTDNIISNSGGGSTSFVLPTENELLQILIDHMDEIKNGASNNITFYPVGDDNSGIGHEITSPYGNREIDGKIEFHPGIDISGNIGDQINSVFNGKVSTVGFSKTFGNYIVITHANGVTTQYSHLSKVNVIYGQNVKGGQEIGELGSTGRSTGPHLDLMVKINGKYINPESIGIH